MSVNEEADGLRLLILVGACGAFAAVLRNHAEIVLAPANRQSPKSAALPRFQIGPFLACQTSTFRSAPVPRRIGGRIGGPILIFS
jgi:hypothetical protein